MSVVWLRIPNVVLSGLSGASRPAVVGAGEVGLVIWDNTPPSQLRGIHPVVHRIVCILDTGSMNHYLHNLGGARHARVRFT